jgi:hypothetical protein
MVGAGVVLHAASAAETATLTSRRAGRMMFMAALLT